MKEKIKDFIIYILINMGGNPITLIYKGVTLLQKLYLTFLILAYFYAKIFNNASTISINEEGYKMLIILTLAKAMFKIAKKFAK